MNGLSNTSITCFRKMALFISERKQQIRTIGFGQLMYSLICWIYDNPLYIVVIALLGPIIGGGLMTLGSIIICLSLILWYNRCKVDWLGVNAIDSIRTWSLYYAEKLAKWQTDSYAGKILFIMCYIPIRIILFGTRFANHRVYGNTMAFILLSIFEDPFITTAYLRHGYYGPMINRDWFIFFASVILSNGYWIFRTTVIIHIGQVFAKIF